MKDFILPALLVIIFGTISFQQNTVEGKLRHDLAVTKGLLDTANNVYNAQQAETLVLQRVFKAVFGTQYKKDNLRETIVLASSYNPLARQTDSTPLIASDNKLVEPGIFALPQHYRKALGMPMRQRVVLENIEDETPLGPFLIRDHMNDNRPAGRGDIISFIPKWSKRWGKKNVRMFWVVKEEIQEKEGEI